MLPRDVTIYGVFVNFPKLVMWLPMKNTPLVSVLGTGAGQTQSHGQHGGAAAGVHPGG